MLAPSNNILVEGTHLKNVKNRWFDLLFMLLGVVVIVGSCIKLVSKYQLQSEFKWQDIKYVVFIILAGNSGFQFFKKQQLSKQRIFEIAGDELFFIDTVTQASNTLKITDIKGIRITYDEVLFISLQSGLSYEILIENWMEPKKAELKEWISNYEKAVA